MSDKQHIEIRVPFIVHPKQGDRSTKSGIHYQPKKVTQNAAQLTALLSPYAPKVPMVGPLSLDVTYTYPWRKSASKGNREKLWQYKDTRPDLDNLCKQLCDVMERMGFFTNDAQLAAVNACKQWASAAGIMIRLEEL